MLLVMLSKIVCLLREMLHRNRIECYIVKVIPSLKGYKIVSLPSSETPCLRVLGQEKEQVAILRSQN